MKVIIEVGDNTGPVETDEMLLERIDDTFILSQLEEETGQEHVMLFTREQAEKLQEALQLLLETT